MPKTQNQAEPAGSKPVGPWGVGRKEFAFFLGTAVYFVLFYRLDRALAFYAPWLAPLLNVLNRWLGGDRWADIRWFHLSWIVRPDDLLNHWVGGDFQRLGMWDRLPVLLAAALILFIALVVGRLLMRALRADGGLSRLELFVFASGVGLNVISLFTLAVGLAGWLDKAFVYLLAAVGVLLVSAARWKDWLPEHQQKTPARKGERRARASSEGRSGFEQGANSARSPVDSRGTGRRKSATSRTSNGPPPFSDSADSDWLRRCGRWGTVPFVVVMLLGGMLPPWHFDVREYHLQVPKEWYQQGHVGFMPHNVYGNMPLGAEMHAILGMVMMPGEHDWWYGALIGKTVIASFALLTALAVFAAGRRFFSPTAGAVAAFAFVTTPWVAYVSMAGLIDVGSAFYLLLAVYALLLWRSDGHGEGSRDGPAAARTARGRVFLAGFLAGSAVACKYPAVLFVVLPLLLWTLLVPLLPRQRGSVHKPEAQAKGPSLDKPESRAKGPLLALQARLVSLSAEAIRRICWKPAALFLIATLCACGLWFGKNWVLTGNPTYPLLYEWFDGKTRTAEKDAQWTRAHQTPRDGNGRSYTLTQLKDSLRLVAISSEFTSPLLVPFGILALFCGKHRRLVLVLVAMIVCVAAAWWLLTHRVDRFLMPLLPLVALLVGVGATWSSDPVWKRCVLALLAWCLVANLPLVASRSAGDNRFFVALEELRVVQPQELNEYNPHIHPAHLFLNRAVPDGFKVLLCGEAQVFNLTVPILYNTCFDDCVFEQLMKDRSRDQRLAALRENRISHVFVFWYELDRYRSPGNYGYSNYVTRDRVRRELVEQQGLLRPVPLDIDPDNSQLFEVVGWREWVDE